ncbi:hypothetical protein SLE2022_233670 [Rubroshorea leprosula]
MTSQWTRKHDSNLTFPFHTAAFIHLSNPDGFSSHRLFSIIAFLSGVAGAVSVVLHLRKRQTYCSRCSVS